MMTLPKARESFMRCSGFDRPDLCVTLIERLSFDTIPPQRSPLYKPLKKSRGWIRGVFLASLSAPEYEGSV